MPVHCVAPLLKEDEEHHTQRQKIDSPLRGAAAAVNHLSNSGNPVPERTLSAAFSTRPHHPQHPQQQPPNRFPIDCSDTESDDSTVRMGDKDDDDMDIASDGVENGIDQLEAIDALINLGVKTVRKTDVISNMSPKTEGHGTDSDSPSGAPLHGAHIDDNDKVFL